MTNDEPGGLAALSDALEEAVAKAARSTVRVEARRRLPSSGIVWDRDVIVTAAHTIERDEEITIGLPDGGELAVSLAGRDDGSDIAVLRVEGAELEPPDWTEEAVVGRLVVAVARPGLHPEAAFGMIRAIGGSWRARGGVPVEGFLRSDSTLYPGFSGGPLADTRGRVLGMNTSRYSADDGFTVPYAAARPIVEALLSDGEIRPAYIGAASQPARLPDDVSARLEGQESGLLVVSVEPGTPAAAAGLLLGDVIVRLAGNPIRQTDDLMAELLPGRVGQSLDLTVVRAGELRELAVTPVERPGESEAPQHPGGRSWGRRGRRSRRG